MNSEELEQSLRSEFETYLNDILAEKKQDLTDFQQRIEAEFKKHQDLISEAFKDFDTKLNAEFVFDQAFTSSVVEHLRLAKDEGAKITANAFAAAEKLEASSDAQAAPVKFGSLRDAINDIASKTTQSAILKALVDHAGEYTSRGAFFIIKNEHLIGWKVFGKEMEDDDAVIREIRFPVSADTILSKAVSNVDTVASAYGLYTEDAQFLEPLGFGEPASMFSVPLTARGRGVAVLYADTGSANEAVNTEAIETLVRVAGLTVELLASSNAQKPVDAEPAAVAAEQSQTQYAEPVQEEAAEEVQEEYTPTYETPVYTEQNFSAETEEAVEETASVETSEFDEVEPAASFEEKPKVEPYGSFEYSEPTSISYDETAESETAEDDEPVAELESVKTEDAATFTPATSFDSPAETSSEVYTEFESTEEVEASEPSSSDEVYEISSDSGSGSLDEYEFETTQTDETVETFEYSEPSPVFDVQEDARVETVEFESSGFDANQYEQNPPPLSSNGSYTYSEPETVEEVSMPEAAVSVQTEAAEPAAAPRSGFRDRNVDLPIEVAEDERRLHNDARRFARLLVSEIKLYNEQKVVEGRQSNDLYERLKEAIDRSREMYDKRVQPPVASKFDYFHYELVNSLAEGETTRLGSNYPGGTV